MMQHYKITLTQDEINTLHIALIEYVHRLSTINEKSKENFLEEVKDTIRNEITKANALRVKLPRYYRPE